MKTNYIYHIGIVLLVLVFTTGCKPEYKPIGEPLDKYEGINGTWLFEKCELTDDLSPIKETRDFTGLYANESDPFKMTFDSGNRSYTIDITTGKNYLGSTGNFSLDDAVAASEILLTPADAAIDPITLELAKPVVFYDNTLSIAFSRSCFTEDALGNKSFSYSNTYTYTFTRQ